MRRGVTDTDIATRQATAPRLSTGGWLLGFGLGGFFDGILLHQILQWHHLLSLVEGVGDLRAQMLFDGLFHAAMYVIAAAGLALLWRDRHALARPGAGRRLLGILLVGFGSWHIADGVLSHWVLGIHRIRLDSAHPLAWDMGWFLGLGILPVVLENRFGAGGGGGRGRGLLPGLTLLAAAGAVWSAWPPPVTGSRLVIFRPGIRDGVALAAIRAAGGEPLTRMHGVWIVGWPAGTRVASLYREGALLVGGSFAGAGCLGWSSASTQR